MRILVGDAMAGWAEERWSGSDREMVVSKTYNHYDIISSSSVVELTSFASLSLRFSIDELHAENGERDQDESTHMVLSARRTLDSEGNTASSPLAQGPVNQSRGARQVTCRRFIEES